MILSGDFTPPKSREQSMLGKVTEVMQPPNEKPVLKIPEDGKSTKNLGMIYFSPQVQRTNDLGMISFGPPPKRTNDLGMVSFGPTNYAKKDIGGLSFGPSTGFAKKYPAHEPR